MTAVKWTNDESHGLVLFNANESVAEIYFSSFAPDGVLEYLFMTNLPPLAPPLVFLHQTADNCIKAH
jgi:hypothetical protein